MEESTRKVIARAFAHRTHDQAQNLKADGQAISRLATLIADLANGDLPYRKILSDLIGSEAAKELIDLSTDLANASK